MSVVVPALLAATKEELDLQLARMTPLSNRLHLDLMDGQFAPTTSLAPKFTEWPEGYIVDWHLMYRQPESQIKIIFDRKPNMVIIHAEAEGNLLQFMETLQKNGIKAGVALMRSTVPADVADLIAIADHVLIFSGNLGQYGGKVNFLQLEKVRLIRAINPGVEIGWDGGANTSNAYTLALGGTDVLNVGGALATATDPAEVYKQLDFEVHRKDVFSKQAADKKQESTQG